MLETIKLVGWQTHKNLTIKFDPRITTITGPSESGKSAIVRALRWVILNQWNGEVDIHHDCSVAKVKLWIDGHEVTRKRSTSNLYRLDNSKFKALGKFGVPEAIAQVMNITELNFQDQFDPHFWLSASAGQVSKELNSIIDLDIIDLAITNANSKMRVAKVAVDLNKERLVEAKRTKKQLSWVPNAIESLQQSEESLTKRQSQIASLQTLCTSINESTETKERLESCLEHGEKAVTLHVKLSRTEKLEILIQRMRQQCRIKNLDIPKLDDTLSGKISDLQRIIESVKEMQWLAKQKCPVCEKTL
jgi:exonuclease SbcC